MKPQRGAHILSGQLLTFDFRLGSNFAGPFALAGFEVEKSKNFGRIQAQRGDRAIPIAQDTGENLAFFVEHAVDSLFDRVIADEFRDDHLTFLPNAVRPVDGLVLDRRVPPAVVEKHVASELQIQPHSSGPVAHEQQRAIGILFELAEDGLSFFGGDFSVIDQRIEAF